MEWGKLYWPFYLILSSVLFLGPEIYALCTNVYNTLSDYCWRQLHVGLSYTPQGMHTAAWWFSIIAWAVFVVVITMHIWFRVTP